MDAALLHVITAIYNPVRWRSRIEHCRRFAAHMLDSGVKLTIVECALGQRPYELDDIQAVEHIPVRARTLAWNKEALLNVGLARSRYRTPYIAWIDADVLFSKPNWAVETVHALQQYAVVQPWSSALDLGPEGEPMLIKGFHVQTSFAKVWHELGDIGPIEAGEGPYAAGWAYPHPGYAWAIRRDTLNDIGGLIEASGLGAGDHQMAMAFIGKFENSIHGAMHPHYQAMVRGWAEKAYRYVQGNLGHVGGTISHLWHGEKSRRKYEDRWQILIDEQFNPLTDLSRNLDGVIELAGNKPRLAHRFDQYFRQRDEDANIRLGA